MIGLTVVAVGTSLPELAASLAAALKGQHEMAVANLVGSNIFNLLLILGACALLAPIELPALLLSDFWAALASAIVLAPFVYRLRAFTRPVGALLVLGYAAFLWSAVRAG